MGMFHCPGNTQYGSNNLSPPPPPGSVLNADQGGGGGTGFQKGEGPGNC